MGGVDPAEVQRHRGVRFDVHPHGTRVAGDADLVSICDTATSGRAVGEVRDDRTDIRDIDGGRIGVLQAAAVLGMHFRAEEMVEEDIA